MELRSPEGKVLGVISHKRRQRSGGLTSVPEQVEVTTSSYFNAMMQDRPGVEEQVRFGFSK